MAKTRRQPFEVSLKDEARQALALELSRALDDALAVRSATESEVEYWHTLYEQGRTRLGKNAPWDDCADLTSYLGTQYVDVMRSQIVKTVMTDPVFTVEGYGQAEAKAPFVEEFHQWQIEAEGFQQVFSRAVHLALIEPWGVIEVYEDTLKRPVRKVIRAALQLAPDGTALVDERLQPLLMRNPDGAYVEVFDEMTPSAEVEIDAYETVCRGPRHRTIAYRDFLQLPGHARDKSEVWGYAKRFSRRLEELQERAAAGLYDKTAVEALGTDDERAAESTVAGVPIGVAAKEGTAKVEKELWELLFLRDLDGKGLRWYVATLHKDKQQLLRIQYDDIGRPRFFPLVPFPRPNSTEGYSYLGHKLITVVEEHTLWRNALSDRAMLQLQPPMLREQGSLWDPETQPIGPREVWTVRRVGEVQAMQFPDQTSPAVERIRDAERAGERLSGINDAAAGVTSEDERTLGEIQLITEQSLGRVSEAVKNIQETLEDIAQVRHLMWKRALKDMGSEGLEAPPSVAMNLRTRLLGLPQPGAMAPDMGMMPQPGLLPPGLPMGMGQPAPLPQTSGVLMGLEQRTPDISSASPNLRFTASMLEGTFRFKPKGSVETADFQRLAFNWNQFLQIMGQLAQSNPFVAAVLQTPQAAKAFIEQSLRIYHIQDKQAFVGSEAVAAMQQAMQLQQMQLLMGQPPGQPPSQGPAS